MSRYIDLDKIKEYKRNSCNSQMECIGDCIECYFCHHIGKYIYEDVVPKEELEKLKEEIKELKDIIKELEK